MQEANEVHREYLAKKNEKNPQNDQVTDSRETQTKKRANSTGRPTAVSNNTTSTSTTRPTGRSRPREDSIGHDDDDNASKHSYRSEVTSSTQGTHNRTTNTRSTAPVGSRTNGIGYAQPKEERDRAKSTGRVNLGAKPYHHNVEIDESVGDRSPRRMSHPEETKRIQKDKLEEEVIEPPQAKTTYQQIQSPSRKNKAAMNELDDEIYSKKAMSYLSTSQKPTATQSSYIPRRRSYDSDDDDNNDAVGNNKDVDIRPSTNYNSEIHRNNIQDDTHRSDPPRNTHHIPQPTGTSGVYESQNQYSKTHTTNTSTSTGLKYESEDTESADEVDMKLAKQYSSHQIRSNILSESELHHVRTASKALEEDDAIPETHYIPPHKASITSTHSNHSRNLYTNSSQLPVPPRTSNNNNHHPPPRENQPPPAQPQVKTENIPRKKGLTVPKSPQFSKMSWQRKENDRPTVISQQQQQQQQELKKKKSESGFLGPKPADKPNMERKRSSSGLKSRPNDGTTDHGHEEIDQHYSQHEIHLKTRKSLSSSTRNPSQSSSGATSSIGGGASGGGGGGGGSSAAGRLGRYYC